MPRHEDALVAHLAALDPGSIPAETMQEASLRLLDQMGCIWAGTHERAAKLAIRYAEARGGTPEATIFGSHVRVDAEHAAFANGVSGHVLELDDGNRYAMGHPAVVVIPAVLALAEAERSTGRDVAAAILAGYELFVRLGTAMNPSHYDRGFHTTGTVGAMAATAACARLVGLDATTMASALGLAGSQAGGLFEFLEDGAMSKQLHAGVAAAAAIRSVRLARAGFTGPTTILEGKNGFLRAMADGADASILDHDLGRGWAINDCYVKLHACCRHIHPVVDAIQELVQRHALTTDDIDTVQVDTYAFAAKLDNREIDTELDAKMSTPYSVAVTLTEGACGLPQFRPELYHDPRITTLMPRVSVHLDPELDALVPDKRGCRVTMETTHGTVHEEVLLPRGEPETPVAADEIRSKYDGLVLGLLDPSDAQRVADAALSLIDLPNVQPLITHTASPEPATLGRSA